MFMEAAGLEPWPPRKRVLISDEFDLLTISATMARLNLSSLEGKQDNYKPVPASSEGEHSLQKCSSPRELC